jgi:hypothetical protein
MPDRADGEALRRPAGYLNLDGAWKLLDLVGSQEWDVRGYFRRGRWDEYGSSFAGIIRARDGIYLVREFPYERGERLRQIPPPLAASWLIQGGVTELPADLLAYARPASPEPFEAASTEAVAPSKRTPAEDRRQGVVAMLEGLTNIGVWGVSCGELAAKAGIKYKTFWGYLNHKDVKPTWERYQRKSVGNRPANLDALGDGELRGFSVLKPN